MAKSGEETKGENMKGEKRGDDTWMMGKKADKRRKEEDRRQTCQDKMRQDNKEKDDNKSIRREEIKQNGRKETK